MYVYKNIIMSQLNVGLVRKNYLSNVWPCVAKSKTKEADFRVFLCTIKYSGVEDPKKKLFIEKVFVGLISYMFV